MFRNPVPVINKMIYEPFLFQTLYRNTVNTRMVLGLDNTISFLLFSSFDVGETSLGLPDPQVAMANASAALELLLRRFDCLAEVITTPALLNFWGKSNNWKLVLAVEEVSPS